MRETHTPAHARRPRRRRAAPPPSARTTCLRRRRSWATASTSCRWGSHGRTARALSSAPPTAATERWPPSAPTGGLALALPLATTARPSARALPHRPGKRRAALRRPASARWRRPSVSQCRRRRRSRRGSRSVLAFLTRAAVPAAGWSHQRSHPTVGGLCALQAPAAAATSKPASSAAVAKLEQLLASVMIPVPPSVYSSSKGDSLLLTRALEVRL